MRSARSSAAPTEKQQTALRDYGLNLGTAFQLIDDLLDFTSSEAALGKAAGADLLGGKVTLPLIYLMAADASDAQMVQRVLRDRSYRDGQPAGSRDALDRTDALERARAGRTNTPKTPAPPSTTCRIPSTATRCAPCRPTSSTATASSVFRVSLNRKLRYAEGVG